MGHIHSRAYPCSHGVKGGVGGVNLQDPIEVRWAGSHQLLQDLIRVVEYSGLRLIHVLHIAQVGNGEVEGERHQDRARGCW